VTTLYTDPDSRAQHALSSPFAFNLGSVSAYLDGDRIIEIAKKEGCQAIHPGYGFVSVSCIVRFGGINTYRNRDD
jgi:3-methylcrotonyl-CoA carboxylase alpha subunit